MNGARVKKAEGKFTIQFNRNDPEHIQAADILNSKERRGKAQYIVNAVLYYESHGGGSGIKYTASGDEKYIEEIVNRILLSRGGNTGILPNTAPSNNVSEQPRLVGGIIGDDMETIGPDGIDAIAGALAMFRKK